MERIDEFLQERTQNNLMRNLHGISARKDAMISINGKDYIDFSSNDYLGLSDHPKLKESAKKAIDAFGTSTSASRLLSGSLEIHHELEEKTAAFKGKESCLVFNSGYQANTGIINALCEKGDAIFSDKLVHASLIDGIQLSKAEHFRFVHNDCEHLENLLNKERRNFKNALIITETVFSMDGDIAPLEELCRLKEKYGCRIFVDEAHATGIFGKQGSGMAEEKGLTEQIDFIMGTFSKALGSFGAYLACEQRIKDYLINTCRSFIYSTALPPAVIAANLAGLEVIQQEPQRRKKLLEMSRHFSNSLKAKGFSATGNSQIVPVIIGQNDKTVTAAEKLKKKGYWVLPIRPPTVPANQGRLRFSLTYSHTKEILERLIYDICSDCKF